LTDVGSPIKVFIKKVTLPEAIARNEKGPIEIEIKFRIDPEDPLGTYELHIGLMNLACQS